jgi:hypothetical protein
MTPDQMKLVAVAVFAGSFTTFSLVIGHLLRTRGRVFLDHTFATHPSVSGSVHFLLNLGFYLLCASLLLWNLGVPPDGYRHQEFGVSDLLESISARLGVSIFAVAAFHSVNVLVLSLLNRRQADAAS